MTTAEKLTPEIQKIEFDIHKMNITQDGLDGFFWPVSYADREKFCGILRQKYCDLIQKYEDNTTTTAPYKLLSKYVLAESVNIFWGDLLRERFQKENIGHNIPQTWRVWPALFQNTPPPPPLFLQKLQEGPNKEASIKQKLSLKRLKKIWSLLKIGGKGLNVDGLKIKPLSDSVLQNDIITVERHGLIINHAKSIQEDVVFCRPNRWFQAISDDELNNQKRENNALINKELMNLLSSLYATFNVPFKDHNQTYFQNIIETGIATLQIHLNRLLIEPKKLPKTLWTGSAGNTWNSLLRLAVIQNNGTAIGHDHGAGLGHVNNPMMGFTEFWGCKEFITFNKNQAEALNKNASAWPCLENPSPKASWIQNKTKKNESQIFAKFKKQNFKVKTIIVMTTLYDHDRSRPGPGSPDIVHIDWQARLITQLQSWGYNVVLKLHPESPTLPPKKFEEEMGAKITTTRLEDMLDEADMILFDHVYTTTFCSVLSTNIPMTLIDFYDHPWTENSKALLEKRCAFIEAQFDDKNRKKIDWNSLKNGIEMSTKLCNNQEFFNYYYG